MRHERPNRVKTHSGEMRITGYWSDYVSWTSAGIACILVLSVSVQSRLAVRELEREIVVLRHDVGELQKTSARASPILPTRPVDLEIDANRPFQGSTDAPLRDCDKITA